MGWVGKSMEVRERGSIGYIVTQTGIYIDRLH